MDLRDDSNAPLVSFKKASVALTDVDPLHESAILGDIGVDGLAACLVRHPGGSTNFTPLTDLAQSKKLQPVKIGGLKLANVLLFTCLCDRLISQTASLISGTKLVRRQWCSILRVFMLALRILRITRGRRWFRFRCRRISAMARLGW